jgi:hypothetical protein
MIAAYLSAVLGPVVDVTCNPFGYKAERSMMSIMKPHFMHVFTMPALY